MSRFICGAVGEVFMERGQLKDNFPKQGNVKALRMGGGTNDINVHGYTDVPQKLSQDN